MESIEFVVLGVVIFLAGRYLAEGSAARSFIQILGASGILLAPILWRAEGTLAIGPKGFTVTLTGRKRILEGLLPFLSGEVASEVVVVPPAFRWAGSRLMDPPLHFVRQELQLSVVALRRPGQRQWEAGGVVSTTPLEPGMELHVCGPAPAIEELRQRFHQA